MNHQPGGFYVYEYVHKEGVRAEVRTVLHHADCRWCQHGQGHRQNAGSKTGLLRWHGPFAALPEALAAAEAIAAPRSCVHCQPF